MTLIVNLYGAPGAGKSTTAAGVFHKLKLNGINAEYVTEVAKDFTWEGRTVALGCQPYVFGKQFRDVYRLIGQVDVIVTDSPVFLSAFYNWKYPNKQVAPEFNNYVIEQSKLLGGLNFLIERTKDYNPKGRNQTEEESDEINHQLRFFLSLHKMNFEIFYGNATTVDIIYTKIVNELNADKTAFASNINTKFKMENIITMEPDKTKTKTKPKLELYGIFTGDSSYGDMVETTNSLEEAEKLAKQYAEENKDDEYYIVKYIKKVKIKASVVEYEVEDDA